MKSSERQMQAELELPPRCDYRTNDSGGRHSQFVIRQAEFGGVEQVESLSGEQQSESLLERSGALQAHVVVELARPAQNVAPGIAVGVGCRGHEGRRVIPITRTLIGGIEGRARNHIGPRRSACIGRIVAQDGRGGEPSLYRAYTGK